jgi:hypothetical protein
MIRGGQTMIIARAGAALLVLCLGALPAAGAEPSPAAAANGTPAGSSIEDPEPSPILHLAADTRKATTKEQLRSRTAQTGRAAAASDDRVAKLEQRVAELEAQVEQLLSILEVDGQDVAIRGRKVRIEGQQSLDVRAAQATVESQGALQLKGASITLNGGSKPIARVGSAVAGGVVSNGASTVLAP